jgi:uncharacterized protein (UPF0335 family)
MSEKEKDMVTSFIQDRKEDIEQKTVSYVKAILDIHKEIKELNKEIKTLTDEAKEEQINVKLAKKAINKLKYLLKTNEDELDEEEEILEFIKNDANIISDINELIQK